LRIELGNLVAANSWGSSLGVLGREILEVPKVGFVRGGKLLRSLRVVEKRRAIAAAPKSL
jgi:hypothetical protein